MPLNDFYIYNISGFTPGKIEAVISIDIHHPMYKGHFPEQPVTPGVVLVEIIRNLLSSVLKKNYMLVSAKEIKFTAALLPAQVSMFDVKIEYSETGDKINTVCIVSKDEKIFAKIKGEFSEQ